MSLRYHIQLRNMTVKVSDIIRELLVIAKRSLVKERVIIITSMYPPHRNLQVEKIDAWYSLCSVEILVGETP